MRSPSQPFPDCPAAPHPLKQRREQLESGAFFGRPPVPRPRGKIARLWPAILGLGLAAWTLIGCGRSGPTLIPVEGKVTFQGRPLQTGSLVFQPDRDKGNQSSLTPSGTIGSDGRYQLFTQERPGAPPGWYKVGIVAQEAPPNDPYAMRSRIPQRYNDPQTSGISVEVSKSAAAGAYDLQLTP